MLTTVEGWKTDGIKKTELDAFSNPRTAGIIALDINEGDDLLSVGLSSGESEIFIGTRNGMAIRFNESDVRLLATLANSMSVALENARLFDETQRLLKETEQRAA